MLFFWNESFREGRQIVGFRTPPFLAIHVGVSQLSHPKFTFALTGVEQVEIVDTNRRLQASHWWQGWCEPKEGQEGASASCSNVQRAQRRFEPSSVAVKTIHRDTAEDSHFELIW